MCPGCSCPHRPSLAIRFLLIVSTQAHRRDDAWLAFPVGESSEETPSAEVPRAFHSDVGVEAALDLLATHLTQAQSSSFPPYTCHMGRALIPARTSDPLGMHEHFPSVLAVKETLEKKTSFPVCYTVNVGKWLECFRFAWSVMHDVSFLFSLNFWSIFKEISAQPIIQ